MSSQTPQSTSLSISRSGVTLHEILTARVEKNPSYSLRAFARSLKMSPPFLSRVMRGERQLSIRKGLSVAKILGITGVELDIFKQALIGDADSAVSSQTLALRQEQQKQVTDMLSMEYFRMISDWKCSAIVALSGLPTFKATPQWVSTRLGISRKDSKESLAVLSRLGILKKSAESQLQGKGIWFRTSQDIPSEAIRQFHRGVIQKALESLDAVKVDRRDISGVTVLIDPKRLPIAKRRIQKFRRELAHYLSRGKGCSKVYHFELMLFPLAQRRGSA
jgi:uncharacterized protein (TIGR02147 family)